MAKREHLAILRQGTDLWNDWRKEHSQIKPELDNAAIDDGFFLQNINLAGASLFHTKFVWADLSNANLSNANLIGANFKFSRLSEANLSGANLIGATFDRTMLNGANLRKTSLLGVNFTAVELGKINLSQASIGNTVLTKLDLGRTKGLSSVKHIAPSTIGIDTLYLSKGNIPEIFLRGCGVPEDMIAFAHSMRGNAYKFYSCFIGHSMKDKRFYKRLYADLTAKGVRVWLFEEDAKWGEAVWGEIDHSIRVYDKFIVICSKNSLQSGPVIREIERALNREDKEGNGILFPVRIDNYIFEKWDHPRKADVLAKVVGDFCDWDKDAVKYDRAFEKLLKGLQSERRKS